MSDLEPMHELRTGTAPRLPARTVLEGFRDLGVPDESSEKLACEPSLNRYTAYWVLGNTLDAGYAALEGMLWASKERAFSWIDEHRPTILSYLARCYNEEDHRFATDSTERTRGLFATHTAIGIMRSLERLRPKQRLTKTRFTDCLKEMGVRAPDLGPKALKDLLAESRCGDAVVENPNKPLLPSLTALYTASLIHYSLAGESATNGDLGGFIEPSRLERFFFGCLKRQRVDDGWASGFVIHPDHSELCVNTTFFGLSLMERQGIHLEPGCKQEIAAFLAQSCKDGGFSSTRSESRSLNATYWGLRALKIVAPDGWGGFLQKRREAIKAFVRSCWNPKSGGARFAMDASRYAENCLATRYWLQIQREFDLGLTDSEKDKAFGFFQAQFDTATGGFRGYPEARVDASEFGPDTLEGFLDEKDRKLLEHHHSRLHGPSASSYFPDTRMIELYDRLAELEHESLRRRKDPMAVREETEEVWRQLQARQEAEAARFEAQFDAEILAPLRAGRAELAALRERHAGR